ncbi:serine threonine- kinase EDR1-like isoform X1 [Olea europaea subsp. europaea]|uniref:non-specific serine/threonine protein kinase n=1 Tax=Olea europaea subsp. europaea TaxID=158383 RepID=A0A8S0UDX7_OLEEU|nr:serine threonine- kinase EDR1-like isoform X1 [Olea europaea subsp. europaea]
MALMLQVVPPQSRHYNHHHNLTTTTNKNIPHNHSTITKKSDPKLYNYRKIRSKITILWSTGILSEPIPNGFYYVVPDKKLKELYEDIPTLEELHALELEGFRAEVILVDAVKDKKLSMLKQLIVTLVKGLNANPAAMIKKIAGLVSDVYGRSNSELSPKKAVLEDASHISENQGMQMLGQIKHGSCRPRAILFKVLADTVGLENTLPHSEPNIAATFWRRGRRQIIPEQRTASSSPEHPSFHARGRSMLSGDNKSFRDYSNDIATSRSEGASMPDTRRTRRRSISMTPEIGDDIVRAVRAMNESLKQNRVLREQQDTSLYSFGSADQHGTDQLKDDNMSGGRSSLYPPRGQTNSQKAMSLPSSPHELSSPTPDRIGTHKVKEEMVSAWNRVLGLPMFQNKPLLPFEEWNIDFSELTVGTRVGIGFFGEVFRGVWNGTEVAIKVFLEQDLTAENMEDFCNEISILSRLRHPNVILFLGACTRPPQLSMVTEYMEMGSLYYLIRLSGQKNKLSWRRRIKMLRDICRGLMCLHRMKIVHRDLKSANCLVNKHSTVKICDFGLSRIMTDTTMRDSSSAGTPEWMAPELIRNEPFTVKCDIFSLGVIMWELCTLNKPWDGTPPERVVYAVANEGSRLEIPEGPLGRLIADCWAEPDERPSCEEILPRLLDCELSLS